MRRLLIADAAGELAKGIKKQLGELYHIQTCRDGEVISEHVCSFEPDILLLDMSIPGADCFGLLQTLVASGKQTAVLVLLKQASDYTLSRLQMLGVKYILTKPCAVNLAVYHIRQVDFLQQHPNLTEWCLENEMENILISLSFAIGKGRYNVVCQAIFYKYLHFESQMKEIYLSLAEQRGSTSTQVEKAIRDAVADAYKNGDPGIWRMYFIPRRNSKSSCPTNEEFIARIAECLRQKTRLKKPYIAEMQKAE